MARLDKLVHLLECDSTETWGTSLFSIGRDWGYDYLLFGIVPSKGVPLEDAFIKSNYPSQWRSIYDASQLHYIDPTVSHCLRSIMPLAWNAKTFKGRVQSEFYEQASGYGLRSGISFPVHGAGGEFGILSLATSDPVHGASVEDVETLAALSLLRDYTFESSIKFLETSSRAPAPVKLTARELECLRWVMEGKSSWEISQIRMCSEATINFHVLNLKKKFNVQTRQQAVVRAIKLGLIAPS